MKAYVPVYRKLLARAWKTAWQHRGLWVFGFLAGLAQTGAVTNDVLRLAPALEPGSISWTTLEEHWNAFTFGKTMLEGVVTATPQQLWVTIGYFVVTSIVIVLLVLCSQHILLTSAHRAARNKNRLHWRDISGELRSIHLGRLFSINILTRIVTVIVILAGSLLLRDIIASAPEVATIATFAMYLVVLPLTFMLSAIGMNALIHVARENDGILKGLHHSIGFFTQHWLPTMEFAGILFLINMLYTIGLVMAIVILSQLMVAIFAATITSASALLVLFTLSAFAIVAVIVLMFGWMTTFNYCAWTEFVERYVKFPAHARSEHAAAWLHKAFIR